jgi:hypothetical protein
MMMAQAIARLMQSQSMHEQPTQGRCRKSMNSSLRNKESDRGPAHNAGAAAVGIIG